MPEPLGSAAVELLSSGIRPQGALTGVPFQQWVFPDGKPWASFWRKGGDYLVRFPDLAEFEISADGREIRMWRPPGVRESTAANLYLNQAVPLAMGRQGALVLHASAVEVAGRCAAFVGASGFGKSTLAAAFATRGHPFLCDDALVVGISGQDVTGMPGHPSIRLWSDSEAAIVGAQADKSEALEYTDKARLLSGAILPHLPDPRRLGALYFIGQEDVPATHIEPAPSLQATIGLLKHSFILDTEEHEALRRHLDQVAQVASLHRCFVLEYPRRYDELPLVVSAIVEHISRQP